MVLTLSSPAFAHGKPIPVKFTRDGANLSPELLWSGVPAGTRSFALIIADPDAPRGTFHHWAAFDMPADSRGLPEGAGKPGNAFRSGLNDFGNVGYDGPEPPVGHGMHHYHFRLAALDIPTLGLRERARVEAVWEAAKQRALATAELVGTYER
jgi:Raf kinase inhibitor-like YbhB/YbcL family protein